MKGTQETGGRTVLARWEDRGRALVLFERAMPGERHSPFTFSINGRDREGEMLFRVSTEFRTVEDVQAWMRRVFEGLDARPVQSKYAACWYPPGTTEVCPNSQRKGWTIGEHIRAVGGECDDLWCGRARAKEAARAARRTGITAASLAGRLTRAGFPNTAKRNDGTCSSGGFSAGGELRNRRVAITWHGENGRVAGPEDGLLPGRLGEIAAFLQSKELRVEVNERRSFLRVYPKGSAGDGETEYAPGM